MCDVGAYGMSLSSNYNVRPKATELLIKRTQKLKLLIKDRSSKTMSVASDNND
jgi:diaminopimelate decarboxylase